MCVPSVVLLDVQVPASKDGGSDGVPDDEACLAASLLLS